MSTGATRQSMQSHVIEIPDFAGAGHKHQNRCRPVCIERKSRQTSAIQTMQLSLYLAAKGCREVLGNGVNGDELGHHQNGLHVGAHSLMTPWDHS